jgi:hypothetical protein
MPSFISNCPKDALGRAFIVRLGGYENPLQTPIGYTHLIDMGCKIQKPVAIMNI